MTMKESFRIGECFPKVTFGTSGVRALVVDLNTEAVFAYVYAFIQQMRVVHSIRDGDVVAVGMDLRPSSASIAATVCGTLQLLGFRVEFLGMLPTPALGLRCLAGSMPGVMVTGSHIPFDRNGIKFYSPVGEILKANEQAIVSCPIPTHAVGKLPAMPSLPVVDVTATEAYVCRYVDHFGAQCLAGLRVGLYEHSAVGRDITKTVLLQLGAEVVSLGRSNDFVPVDTEAVDEADLAQARVWCEAHRLDAVVSTDGDGDRPLVFDENGEFVRGDLLGLMCARDLGIQTLAVPVSCNSAIERCGAFRQVVRTRIGSPFVIAAMNDLTCKSPEPVAGFEANGGFLLGAAVSGLAALPTRDALLPMLSLLVRSAKEQRSISALVGALPDRYTYSDRIKNCSAEQSRDFLQRLIMNHGLQASVAGKMATPNEINTTDGVRLTFPDGDIVHLRASGNAPELRCYAEAANLDAAKSLCIGTLSRIL
ncbi:phosphomannomutase [Laribacter hongkongensis]|uniref:phosphomannomutase n=1 Tax=Laribacter hongkongensis TaxID=168471 RepID=UPI001EFC8FB3|nr:phosphomannomutase [Laribacter hongkongensis]MCG9098023.1 phosphomannomutase [Laribacter hongkongensis]